MRRLALALLVLAGCGGRGTTHEPTVLPVPSSCTLSFVGSSTVSGPAGSDISMEVLATGPDGKPTNDVIVEWSSSDPLYGLGQDASGFQEVSPPAYTLTPGVAQTVARPEVPGTFHATARATNSQSNVLTFTVVGR